MTNGQILPWIETASLDPLLLEDNRRQVRLFPARVWQALPAAALRIWCHRQARYGIVTTELVDFLTPFLVPDATIEIGAGQGDLGYHLGITMTDSYIQQEPALRSYYAGLEQPATRPPPLVRKLEAKAAILKYRPRVVIGSWITQKFQEGDTEANVASSIYGPDEFFIRQNVDTYIHLGNRGVHATKRILAQPHEEISPPWLVSRAQDPAQNFIAIWKRRP